jgi:hypothetical protein
MNFVEAMRYKQEGRRFDFEGAIGIFHLHNPSGRIMALWPVSRAHKLTTFMYRLS